MATSEWFGIRAGLSSISVALVVVVNIAFISLILAFSAPYWLEGEKTEDDVHHKMHAGVWSSCVTYTNTVSSTSYKECQNTADHVEDAWSDDWVVGTQALMVIALIASIGMEGLCHAYVFIPKLDRNNAAIFWGMCLSFTAGCLTLVTFVVYALRQGTDSQLAGSKLSWAFGFGIVACIFCFVTTIFLLAESMDILATAAFERQDVNPKALHRTAQRRGRIAPSWNVTPTTGSGTTGLVPAALLPTEPPTYAECEGYL